MKARIIQERQWQMFPSNIITNIREIAAKGYGVKFISKDTGEECDEFALIGLFAPAIKKAMEDADI